MRRRLVKLVRDRIGGHLGTTTVSYEPIDDHEEHVRRLRGKLIEESVEYLLSPSVGELADVVQAVEDLAVVDLGVEMGEVLDKAQRKADERGGFGRGTGMYVQTTAPSEHEGEHA